MTKDGSFQNVVSLLNYNTIYYYVACSRVWDRDIYGKIKIFTTEPCSEVVDLGLSVKWRGWNLGAYRPEEYGDYFAWGETEPKSYYDYTNYKWCNGSETTLTKYNDNSYYGSVDNDKIKYQVDGILFSIDGTTQEVYEQYRVNGNYDRVISSGNSSSHSKKKKIMKYI